MSQEELEEERLRVKAKYAKKLSDVDKGIVEEAQKSQVEKMSQVFLLLKVNINLGEIIYMILFRMLPKNSRISHNDGSKYISNYANCIDYEKSINERQEFISWGS